MQEDSLSSMYSKKSLQALEQTLQLHRALVWVDPATNQIAIKRINQAEDNGQTDHFSTNNA